MTKGTGTGTNQQPNPPKYQITATIEKIDFESDEIKLQLKGCNKWFFESENDKHKKYNILELLEQQTQSQTQPEKLIFLDSKDICFSINNQVLANNPLSQAFMENKRLKFEIIEQEINQEKDKQKKNEQKKDEKENKKEYRITSISKAD
jgi:hypothetical protein